jgi:hypothetical protein
MSMRKAWLEDLNYRDKKFLLLTMKKYTQKKPEMSW